MKLVVFGATGGIGSQVVEQALAAGHEVTAVARRPEAITTRHFCLHIVTGDVLEVSTLEAPIAGADVVISALGVRDSGPTTLYSVGVSNIMAAMEKSCVQRLICISADGLDVSPAAPLWRKLVTKYVIQRLFKDSYQDLERMENIVERSGLDWTIMRPPRLTNGAHTGTYQTAINDYLRRALSISRADVADCILTHLANPSTYHARLEVAY